jgi:methanogenic corrinoid protein MtbC1
VLRVWERRYGVVEPRRSTGGQRVYSDSDIERLSLLQRATQGGHGISHVASLSRSRLEELVRDIEAARRTSAPETARPFESRDLIRKAIELTEALDPNGLELLLKRSIARYGLVAFVDSIAAPFLRMVGDRWHSGMLTVSQEHFATAVLQRVVTDTAPLLTGADGGPTIVIGTLEGERHANGALMAAATAASEGWRVIYLGPDLPAGDIADTATRMRARAIGISVVLAEKNSRARADLRHLAKAIAPGTTILVGGSGSRGLRESLPGTESVFVESMEALRTELAAMKTNV